MIVNKRFMKSISLLSLIVIYIFTNMYYLFPNFTNYIEYINVAFILIMTFLSILIFGFKKDKSNELKKTTITTELILLFGFFIFYYGSGLIFGFLKTGYALNLKSVFDNIIPPIFMIIGVEVFRYVIINANNDDKLLKKIVLFIICLFEVVIAVSTYKANNYEDLFKIITLIIIPVITRNIAMNYTTGYIGIKPNLIFRFATELYIYLVPIVPDLGEYFDAMINIGLPVVFYVLSYRIIDDHINGIEYDFKKNILRKTDIPMIIFIVVLTCVISGNFRYHLIGIGSGSMSPKIEKGDAVLLNKKKIKGKIEKGEIVAYRKSGKIIVHRVVEVINEKGTYYYKTKGDANNSNDSGLLTNKDIVGVVMFKIKYIGYPSIFLSETFQKPVNK